MQHAPATPQHETVGERLHDSAATSEQAIDAAASVGHSLGTPSANPQENILQLQRTQGNAAARRWAESHRSTNTLQRQNHPPATATAPPAAAATESWRAPEVFDDVTGTARTKAEAGLMVLVMADRMRDCAGRLRDIHEATTSLDQSITSATTIITHIRSTADAEPNLTQDDLNRLNIFGEFAETAYRNGLNRLSARAIADMEPLQQAPETASLDAHAEQLQERLHQAFMDGTTDSSVSRIRQGLDAINEYKERADQVVTWGRRVSGFLRWTRASEFLTRVGEHSENLGQGLEAIRNVASAADNLQTLFGDRASGGNGIAQFRAALNLIDATGPLMKAIPGMNVLWNGYYAPMTRQILNALSVVFALQDRQARNLTLLEWMQDTDRVEGVAPTIPRELMSHFPGGQPILNFMFALMNGGDASVNQTVEDFFVSHQSLFNAAQEQESEQLQTESTARWYNPFSWVGSRRVAPNLMQWVRSHKETVWAQLYGSLPHNLRG